jgi:hypothetical protein
MPKAKTEFAPVGRDALLARSGKLEEARVEIDGLGHVVVRELSGAQRAALMQAQVEAAQGGNLDILGYQRQLLLYGLVDPDSPEGAREPLLEKADLDMAMGLGGGLVDALCTRIEELSGLSVVDAAAASGPSPLGVSP